MIPIGYYRPDLAPGNAGISGTVLNALLIRDENGVAYAPHPSLQPLATSDQLPAAPHGSLSVVTKDGVYKTYVGTASKLYEILADGTVAEIGTGYALTSGDDWSMAQFKDYIYFTNTTDGMFRYSIEAGGAVSAVSGAPKARFIFPLFGTLAALDCDGNSRVLQTSKIGDATVWSGDASNRYQEFADGDSLIAGGEIGQTVAILLQRNAVRILARTRDRSLYTTDLLESGVGAQGARGTVFTRGGAYFLDTDGFKMTAGGKPAAIGKDKVSLTFLNSLASGALAQVQGAYDPLNNRVIWIYQTSDNPSDTVMQDGLSYFIDIGEFVPLEGSFQAITTVASAGYALEDLDVYGSIEAVPYSLDSRVWKGGEPTLAGFDGDGYFGFFSGASMACTLDTTAQRNGQWQHITGVTPVTDNSAATIQVGTKRKLADEYTWGDAVSIDDDGFAPVDDAGNVLALRFNAAAGDDWSYMRGFDDPVVTSGGPR